MTSNEFLSSLGDRLLRSYAECFGGIINVGNCADTYLSLEFEKGLSLFFGKRRDEGKPVDESYYIFPKKGATVLFEIDLSRIVHMDGRFYWYAARPNAQDGVDLIQSNYARIDDLSKEAPHYDALLKKQRGQLKGYTNTSHYGYEVAVGVTEDELQRVFHDFINNIFRVRADKEYGDLFRDADSDMRAAEGKAKEAKVLHYSRNYKIVKEAKRMAGYTCEACSFKLEVGSRFIIEGHHKTHVSEGERVSGPSDIAVLCPTCHSIWHALGKETYDITFLKSVLKDKRLIQ